MKEEIKYLMKSVEEAENAKPFIWDTYLSCCHKFYEEMKILVSNF